MTRQAADAGAVPIWPFLFLGSGLLGVGWYDGWFERQASKPEQMIARLQSKGIKVVVFEVDGVMSGASSRGGVPPHYVEEYLAAASSDFLQVARALAKSDFQLAVATSAESSSAKTQNAGPGAYLIGTDLARAFLSRRCPGLLPSFDVMVGYNPKLHGSVPDNLGKRHHMREIAKHYGVRYSQMVLFDTCAQELQNEDGWLGILVRDAKEGFRFDDCLSALL